MFREPSLLGPHTPAWVFLDSMNRGFGAERKRTCWTSRKKGIPGSQRLLPNHRAPTASSQNSFQNRGGLGIDGDEQRLGWRLILFLTYRTPLLSPELPNKNVSPGSTTQPCQQKLCPRKPQLVSKTRIHITHLFLLFSSQNSKTHSAAAPA